MGRRRLKDQHLPRRVYFEHGSYYLVPKGGKRINLGRNYALAMAEYGKRSGPSATDCGSMNGVFDRYLQEVLPLKRERTRRDQTKELENLRAFFGPMYPLDVDGPSIYAYMHERAAPTKKNPNGAPIRANREKALLSHVFTKCIEWGIVKLNPCSGVKRFREEKRTHVPRVTDLDWFRKHAGAMLNAYIDIKLATGLRQGDILKIEMNQVTADELVVPISKSQRADSRTGRVSAGKMRRYALTEELKEFIRQARLLRLKDLSQEPRAKRQLPGMPRKRQVHALFANAEHEPYTESGFQSIWQAHMRKAIEKAVEEGIQFVRFREHDLRALAGKNAKEQGRDPQHLLAHDDPKQTSDYVNRGDEAILPLPVRRRDT